MPTTTNMLIDLNITIDRVVSMEVNVWLCHFSHESEIRSTLFSIESNKLSGSDGIPIDLLKFY